MESVSENPNISGQSIEDPSLVRVLNELGRSINLVTTYGKNHPAAKNALEATIQALNDLFTTRRKMIIGCFNGLMTIDEQLVQTSGTLQKSLERRLSRLRITGLKIARGLTAEELIQLTELLAANDAESFERSLGHSGISHIETEKTSYQAVREGQTVANESDLAGIGGDGILILDDHDHSDSPAGDGVHVEQIVAFLKGDVEADDPETGKALNKAATEPDRLARMLMESVSIRQSASELAGESLNDIILGCLRRTYEGLRKQKAYQSSEGKADLKKSLLMLEESILQRMRELAGEEDPELDRQIVQAIRQMDESLSFEIAAAQYMEHQEAIERSKEQLHQFIQSQGADVAETLLRGSDFPGSDWRRIVLESGNKASRTPGPSLGDGLSTLTEVFEKLESLMRTKNAEGTQVKDLLGQANHNLDDTLDNTREKLAALSQQIKDGNATTIGGKAHRMSRTELLAALSEVAQELMQPLTAINASLEMMMNGYVGTISEEQKDMLRLASNSGEHLKFLMNMLIDIVGCPANKGVDNRYHTTSDQVIAMQNKLAG
ncbi:MAG: hypothetical protein JXR25_16745 [Pontiellaceae bacterium]|nr:hypothetical protein [Pontiellaceae bacterium]MBN2786471.1 hypothetical protein [Pontiellaceae bacterium]